FAVTTVIGLVHQIESRGGAHLPCDTQDLLMPQTVCGPEPIKSLAEVFTHGRVRYLDEMDWIARSCRSRMCGKLFRGGRPTVKYPGFVPPGRLNCPMPPDPRLHTLGRIARTGDE